MPIYLVRVDERTGNVIFLAGEELLIQIEPSGEWEFE
jgi:hypothetical protein